MRPQQTFKPKSLSKFKLGEWIVIKRSLYGNTYTNFGVFLANNLNSSGFHFIRPTFSEVTEKLRLFNPWIIGSWGLGYYPVHFYDELGYFEEWLDPRYEELSDILMQSFFAMGDGKSVPLGEEELQLSELELLSINLMCGESNIK